MPRKGPAPKRPLVNDPVYGSQLVTQLVNKILLKGKKSLAERIVYGALEQARDKTGTDPVITLKRGTGQRQTGPRGAQPPRRWCDLPGARSRCVRSGRPRWRCAGWSASRGNAGRRP